MTRPARILRFAILNTVVALPAMAALPDGYDQLVLKRSANDTVVEAATNLASLLGREYGDTPVIRRERLFEYTTRIHIGTQPDHPQFDEDPLTDEILIERNDRGLLITGSDNTATGFAVYRFLEHFLGWRYYQPGQIGLEQLDQPPDPPALDGDNGILLHEKASYHSRNLSGLKNPAGSPNWFNWNRLREKFQYHHSIHRIITPDLFDDRPEWFAKDENSQPKRPPFSTPHGYNDHPDLSNKDLRSHIIENLSKSKSKSQSQSQSLSGSRFETKGLESGSGFRFGFGFRFFSLSLSLGDSFVFGYFPKTYPWKPSHYFRRWPDWSNHVFDFTNDLAIRLNDHWENTDWGYGGKPDLYLGALSYLTWEKPPDFAVHPSIVPYLTYDRSQWYDPVSREDDLLNIEKWAEKKTMVMGTWDYLFGYGFLMPRSMTKIVEDSIPAIHERGIRAYYSQVMAIWPYDVHTTWLTARLLWDVTADTDTLIDEFYREFYGPADKNMRSFFDIAERTWMEQQGAIGASGQALRSPSEQSEVGQSTGWWLRYWKDPWQAALWKEQDLNKMEDLLQDALAVTRAMASKRFFQRIQQTADLFEATRIFVRYQIRMWDLQTGDHAAGEEVLALRTQLKETLARVAGKYPQSGYADDLEWIDRYNGVGGYIFNLNPDLNPDPDSDPDSDSDLDLLREWCLGQGLQGVPDGKTSESVLFDSDFKHANNPRVWYKWLMDSEGAVMTGLPGGGGYLAHSVRRGNIYQPFVVVPGNYYLGTLDVETAQSPTGEVYIRIDLYDANGKLVAESRRVRIAPTEKYGNQQTLRVLMQAPENAVSGRLFIRFYEMDRGSKAIVTNPDVLRLGRIQDP